MPVLLKIIEFMSLCLDSDEQDIEIYDCTLNEMTFKGKYADANLYDNCIIESLEVTEDGVICFNILQHCHKTKELQKERKTDMMLDKKEYRVGENNSVYGRKYKIDTADKVHVIVKESCKYMTESELEKRIMDDRDSFEDGYNHLEEIDGTLYEVMEDEFTKLYRRAYID